MRSIPLCDGVCHCRASTRDGPRALNGLMMMCQPCPNNLVPPPSSLLRPLPCSHWYQDHSHSSSNTPSSNDEKDENATGKILTNNPPIASALKTFAPRPRPRPLPPVGRTVLYQERTKSVLVHACDRQSLEHSDASTTKSQNFKMTTNTVTNNGTTLSIGSCLFKR